MSSPRKDTPEKLEAKPTPALCVAGSAGTLAVGGLRWQKVYSEIFKLGTVPGHYFVLC